MIQMQMLRYLPLLGMALLLIWLLWKKWDFVSGALSDGNVPSATRVAGMILTIMVAFNELYTTVKTQKFDYQHLVAILIGIGVLFGLVKAGDLISMYKGKNNGNDAQPQ